MTPLLKTLSVITLCALTTSLVFGAVPTTPAFFKRVAGSDNVLLQQSTWELGSNNQRINKLWVHNLDCTGTGCGGSPTDATYITQTASSNLTAEQALANLTTGLLKVTTGTGVLSSAIPGTDYLTPQGNGSQLTNLTKAQVGLDNVQNVDTTHASNITTGTLPIGVIPASVIERMVVVADEAARLALTTATVQNGDVVKQNDTGVAYFVKDDANLNSAAGYEALSVGSAASVPWSGVTSTPDIVTDIAAVPAPAGADLFLVSTGSGTFGLENAATARGSMGLGSLATQAANGVNIDGGAIDGTAIGASSAAAITGTTITGNQINADNLRLDGNTISSITGTLNIDAQNGFIDVLNNRIVLDDLSIVQWGDSDVAGIIGQSGGGGYLSLTVNTEVMRLLRNGTVGIGNTSPNTNVLLDVNGGVRLGNATDGIHLYNGNGAFPINNAAVIRRNSTSGALEIQAGSNANRDMTMGTNGNTYLTMTGSTGVFDFAQTPTVNGTPLGGGTEYSSGSFTFDANTISNNPAFTVAHGLGAAPQKITFHYQVDGSPVTGNSLRQVNYGSWISPSTNRTWGQEAGSLITHTFQPNYAIYFNIGAVGEYARATVSAADATNFTLSWGRFGTPGPATVTVFWEAQT